METLAEDLMTTGDVAEHFGCQIWHLHTLMSRGTLEPTTKIGRWRFFSRNDLPKAERALVEAGFIMPTSVRPDVG
jgi:DNA-binding transcriptional MerR regulator